MCQLTLFHLNVTPAYFSTPFSTLSLLSLFFPISLCAWTQNTQTAENKMQFLRTPLKQERMALMLHTTAPCLPVLKCCRTFSEPSESSVDCTNSTSTMRFSSFAAFSCFSRFPCFFCCFSICKTHKAASWRKGNPRNHSKHTLSTCNAWGYLYYTCNTWLQYTPPIFSLNI